MIIKQDRKFIHQSDRLLISHGYAAEGIKMVRLEHASQEIAEKIAANFCLYQFHHGEYYFGSDEWELFFWCNSVQGKRDYSYFTLSMNDRLSDSEHRLIVDRLLSFLQETFGETDLYVTVQYCVKRDQFRIDADAEALKESLDGKRCDYTMNTGFFGSFHMEDGRLKLWNGRLCFMKKRARSRGYILSSEDILLIHWAMEAGKETENGYAQQV